MKSTKNIFFSILLLFFLAANVHFANAGLIDKQVGLKGNDNVAGAFTENGSTEPDLISIILKIVRLLLSFLGLYLTILILYAGWKWTNAKGNEKEVASAKAIVRDAVMGLVLLLAAFIISEWVIRVTVTQLLS